MISSNANSETNIELDNEKTVSLDNWFIVRQNPCDFFITLQHRNRPNTSFSYVIFKETGAITVDTVATRLIKNLSCLNSSTQKNDTGAQIVTCENNMQFDIWETNLDDVGLTLITALILVDIPKDLLDQEMPKLLQTSMIYQYQAVDAYTNKKCDEK